MQLSISQPKPAVNKPKLLVVDDEPDNLDLLYRTFYREFKVLRAENGYEALELLATQPDVAVIVSDQRMPGMSGTEFLSQTAAKYPNIIRIILTGYTDVDDLVDAINEGKVFKYVQKPWEDDHLRKVVKRALETHVVLKTRTEELQRVLRQESLLNAITNTIRSTHSSEQMMQTIVETVGALMEASLCVLQPTVGGTLGPQTFMYRSPAMAAADADLSAHVDQLAWAVSEVTVLDAAAADGLTHQQQQLWQGLGIQSSILVPLVGAQEPIAVLALHQCGQLRPWEGSEMQLLVTVSDQAALALVQTSTYEQVQALARREQLINTLTQAIRSSLEPEAIFAAITHELGQALQVDGCALSLWTANAEYVECVGLYEPPRAEVLEIATGDASAVGTTLPRSQVPIHTNPVLQQVLDTQQPVALDDLSQHPEMEVQDSLRSPARSLLVVPLIADGQILGSISLRQTQHPRSWQSEEIELAQAVAAQAAIAVQQSRLYQTMRDQAAQLMALDRQKTEFFQNISHEFRTPLTLTLGPLETAVNQGEGLSRDQSAVALRNARKLLRLVNQLLDLQRLDVGRMQPTFRPVAADTFVNEIVTAFRPYCDRKQLHLETQLELCPTLYLDLEKFDKVLYNLLSNAVKFTPANGTITVALTTQAQHCVLTVSDTGIGIRADQLPQLFERFQQADGSVNRRYEGSGLGLALVKELVKLHHGDVTVTSTYGQGTQFSVVIPYGRGHLPPDQVVEAPVNLEKSRAVVELADVDEGEMISTPVILNDVPPVPGDATAKILVVDDNPDLRNYVSHVLQHQGYHVRTAQSGELALELVETDAPDLILTDLMMPGLSGIDVIQRLRADERFHSTPIILLTAKVDDETRISGVEQGADAYLGKPFNDRELLAEVRNLLALKANERRVAELNQYLTESVLRRFLPKSLVQKAAHGQLQLDLQPEPRLVTVLFSDIVSFTPLSEQLGSRRIAQVLNEYLEAMTDAIFESGGTVDKFMGDGVMALFGAPEENSPARQAQHAVDAVQLMHVKLIQLNQRWHAEGMQPVQFRCGIHQGDAVVGMFGSSVRADYTAIGPCVNIASRLQEAAYPDEILVSSEVADHLDGNHLQSVRPVTLRGVNTPLLAHSLKLRLEKTG
jgi:signal transduction histidine kinase/response regulator RpfG family c-di-GMP phosphodiesterase